MSSRNNSNYINMRKHHNYIKYQLIKKSTSFLKRNFEKVNVLDISVGRFGDLHNYVRAGVDHVVGIDPNNDSIQEAIKRNNNKGTNFELYTACITDNTIPKVIEKRTFNIVCCHFTLHYFFKNEKMLQNAIKYVSNVLQSGGYFIVTTLDGNKITFTETPYYLIHKVNDTDQGTQSSYGKGTQSSYGKGTQSSYGKGYYFKLNDGVDTGLYFNTVEQVEYVVNIEEFIGVCKKYSLKLISNKPFRAPNNLRPWEKDISELYTSLVFIKK